MIIYRWWRVRDWLQRMTEGVPGVVVISLVLAWLFAVWFVVERETASGCTSSLSRLQW